MAEARSAFTASLFERDLPPTWQLVSAGYVLNGTQYGLSEPGASDGNTPIVGMKDIVNGAVNLDDLAAIDGDLDTTKKFQLHRGDILLNRTNSPDLVGKVGIVRADSKAVFASYLVRLNVNLDRVDPEFLNFWLNSPIAQQALKRLSTRGVSQANINPTEFQKHCPVPLPPLPEQRRIAEILRGWDDAVVKSNRLTQLREAQYLGLRNKLIDWSSHSKTALTSFLEPVSRPTPKPEAQYRALSIRSHGKGTFDRIVEKPDDVDMDTLFVARAGDIIVNITFAWEGAIALVPPEHDGGLVSHRFPMFLPVVDRANPRYLRHVLRMPRFTYLLGIVSPGGAGRNRVLSKGDFLDLEIPLPGLSEQKRIATILDDAESAISAGVQLRDSLSRQKRGLMQKLLTGEWRLSLQKKKARAS